MNPISDTAFYTCGIRAQDAASANPVCNDRYAKRFMNDRGAEIFARFSGDKVGNKGHVARHGMIDALVHTRLLDDPATYVIAIGAGFDSRAYRTQGGHWFELDEPGIVDYKNAQLATTDCPNELTRIAVDFAQERLIDKLPSLPQDAKVVVVIEGVFFYLTELQISETLSALRLKYPSHVLICDLMTRRFIESRNKNIHSKLKALNAPFKFFPERPALIFQQAGYRLMSHASILVRTVHLLWSKIGAALFARVAPRTANGYAVYVFEMRDSRN